MSTFYPLIVSEVKRLTPDAVSIALEIPGDLNQTFKFQAGQYITIKHQDKSGEIRRAYSIAASPSENKLVVGVKKVPNGIFSTFANDILNPGDTLEVMPPQGRFVYPGSKEEQTFLAVAAGSGITPIISIIKTALESDSKSKFVLLYGNRSLAETMFREELENLTEKYSERFYLYYTFSRQREENALFGRIEGSSINYVIRNQHKAMSFDRAYLCGPEEMIKLTQETLKEGGLLENQISVELFTEQEVEDTLIDQLEGKTQLEVTLDGVLHKLVIDQKALILDALLKNKIDAPYSCQGGVCSTCIAKITEGQASMVKNQILTPGEIKEGLILTCQSHPTSPILKIDYDDV
jgi:ring-1,2-phenylacetyl-CoA epoxidase subunit PaaE